MAVLFAPRIRATDANGDPINGATLTIYNAGTTTPASVYSNPGLTVPLVNPVVADANGWLPQIFASEGAAFDFLPSAGWDFDAESVVALGGSDSDLVRDFGGSRFQVYNTAGVVQIEGGDATGDDTGGQIRIGGWNGTQADEIELDGTINTTGPFTEDGKKLRDVVYTAGGTSSGAATIIVALPNDPTGCRVHEIDIIDLAGTGAGGNITLTVSTDNGATYVASGYYSTYSRTIRASSSQGGSSGAASALIGISGGGLDWGSVIEMKVKHPNGTANSRAQIFGLYYGDDLGNASNEAPLQRFNVGATAVTSRVTHVKITFPATVSCTYRVRPQRGFGE